MQVVEDDDRVEGPDSKTGRRIGLEINDGGLERQRLLSCGFAQGLDRVRVAIDRMDMESRPRQPQRVSTATACDIEDATASWQPINVIGQPRRRRLYFHRIHHFARS
jgi:hypothetical protein